MATFLDLKKSICGFTHREEKAFVIDGFNALERAINDARIWAQRTHIFERAKVYITIPNVSLTGGASLDTAVLYGTETAVQVRSLLRAWLPASDGSVDMPIGLFSRDKWIDARRRVVDMSVESNDSRNWHGYSDAGMPLSIIVFGHSIHFSTNNPCILSSATTTNVNFDAVQWLPDYCEPDDSDFLLDFCIDFMTYRSVYQLNAFLKEDERIAVPERLLADAWTSVIRWDTSLVATATEDSHLE